MLLLFCFFDNHYIQLKFKTLQCLKWKSMSNSFEKTLFFYYCSLIRHKYFLSEQSISAALHSTSLALTYIKTIILTNDTTGSTIGVSGRLEWYWGAISDVGLPGSNVFGLLTSLPCLPSICLHIRWGSQS